MDNPEPPVSYPEQSKAVQLKQTRQTERAEAAPHQPWFDIDAPWSNPTPNAEAETHETLSTSILNQVFKLII